MKRFDQDLAASWQATKKKQRTKRVQECETNTKFLHVADVKARRHQHGNAQGYDEFLIPNVAKEGAG